MIATIILLTLLLINLGVTLGKHGEPKKEDYYNFWETLLATAFLLCLYYFAGLFDKFHSL